MTIILGPHKKMNAPRQTLSLILQRGEGGSSRSVTNVKEGRAKQRCRTLVGIKAAAMGPEILDVSQTKIYVGRRGYGKGFQEDDGDGEGRVDSDVLATAAASVASDVLAMIMRVGKMGIPNRFTTRASERPQDY